MGTLTVYTDGSFRRDGKKVLATWAYVVCETGHAKVGMVKKRRSSSRAEQLAVLKAVQDTDPKHHLVIMTDCRSNVDVVENWFANQVRPRSTDGRRFLSEFLAATSGRHVTLTWVRAHAGNPDNARADRLAHTALRFVWKHNRLDLGLVHASAAA